MYFYLEMDPAGRGFADIAFIPKIQGKVPAMIVELKWNRKAKYTCRIEEYMDL